MVDNRLYRNLSKLGFPMFEPDETPDVNKTLADVVKSNDTRLWEGFPVILANAAKNYQFSPDLVVQHLDTAKQKEQFHELVLLSASVYANYHLSFPWFNKLKKNFSEKDQKRIRTWKNYLVHHSSQKVGSQFDPDRIKGLFELYFEQEAEKNRRVKEKYEEFSMEYALSQLFPPKQKELFKKKLEGTPLTKTEQEYYSRTVRKKVVALANPGLHHLARRLLE